MKKLLTLLLVVAGLQMANASSINYWSPITSSQAESYGNQIIKVNTCKYFQLDFNALRNYMQSAPLERTNKTAFELELPMPDGSTQRFAMVESPIMELGLQVKYPSIKTYAGQSLSDPTATIRIDFTEGGFHAMILASDESVFIDPLNFTTNQGYMIYLKSETIKTNNSTCLFNPKEELNVINNKDLEKIMGNPNNSVQRNAGDTLRTYRLAIACTGEYAQYFSPTPTKAGTLGHMVTTVNRVVGVYEKEVSIRLNIIANTDTLIFLDGTTDPYTASNTATMLTENQLTVTARIGFNNYDIGHVMGTGFGGIAGLGVVCSIGQKAKGVTGLQTPVGDPFDIDFVAHEMGHQFGGNHTFNSSSPGSGSCVGNISAGAAYETGSGSTIMAYAGVCAANDLQPHSDAYFHTKSFDEIRNYTTYTGAGGNSCPVKTVTGNSAPIITSIGSNYTIPRSTPFILTGVVANDPDGDPMTFCWEEFDLGNTTNMNTPAGNGPTVRSFTGSVNSYRIIPNLTALNNNTVTKGEILPAYNRTMKFRLTARDNRSGGGGVTYNPTYIVLTVDSSKGPFLVTQPNTNVTWPGLSMQNITWNVANTDLSPIATSLVNILLSTDGGLTYAYTLATGVPNNGLAAVSLPNVTSTTARIKVEAVGNCFFDISNVNFNISLTIGLNENGLPFETVNVYPNPSTGEFNISWAGKYKGIIEIRISDIQGKVVFSKELNKQYNGFIEKLNLSTVSKGIYTLEANTSEGRIVQKLIVQ